MPGELRYLAGIRCELGKTALALAPVPGPLGRPPGAGHPGVGPQVWHPLVQTAQRQALGSASPHLLCVLSPVGDWAASTGLG